MTAQSVMKINAINDGKENRKTGMDYHKKTDIDEWNRKNGNW